MNSVNLPEIVTKGASRVIPFERVALVLQGGGALGAYQAGVYQAIHEAKIEIDWICGTSIGGINGALIAGNRPERRIERLRDFWETVTKAPVRLPNFSWFADTPWAENGDARLWTNKISAFTTMINGAPGFFSPRPFPPINSPADGPELASYYDITPLQDTLNRLVDFTLINLGSMRFTALATNVRTGAPAAFDNHERSITSAQILASASLPPSFAPMPIDGEYYWDGGVVSNSPMQFVIDNRGWHTALVFQVDLWDANGEPPLDIPSANLRAMEIHGASRLNVSLDQYKKMQKFRNALRRFLEQLPEQCQSDPEVQFLSEQTRAKVATIVQLKYQSDKFETASRMFEFSRRAMEDRWQAGYDDTRLALAEPRVFELPDGNEGARIFDVHHGWSI